MKPGSDRVLVIGGAGVFGGHVGRELARRGARVTIAGRDGARAAAAAAALPAVAAGPHGAVGVDVTDRAAVLRALAGHAVVANCAGPFRGLGAGLLDAALAARCHVVDIADDRGYVGQVLARNDAFAAAGRVAVTGASSLPGISGALAVLAREAAPGEGPPRRARVTLFIGNDNDKGGAAIRSAVAAIGCRLDAPQGPVPGFGDREVVLLPEPFGRRAVYNFDAPDLDLLPALVGARDVSVKVGFELRLATTGFALLAALGSGWGERTARLLAAVGGLARRLGGGSGGAVLVELFFPSGRRARAALSGARDGQRMAALPCALAVRSLLDVRESDAAAPRGALLAFELLGARPMLESLVAAGYTLTGPEA